MRPCRVCGNTEPRQLNRHHLLPKEVRKKNTRQVTIKLCAETMGCGVHLAFHEGDPEAAHKIRHILDDWEIQWMVEQTNSTWVRATYPHKL